ncbi:FAD:protein FMN transferase [Cellulophaga sp. BC115SP]|nr:FAD:protein FMN transferase [Cellulophaga sp. BC115SP]
MPNSMSQVEVHKQGHRLMGNYFEISVVSDNADYANSCIDQAVEEIKRIERLLTTFNDQSQTNQVNAMAGIAPVEVDAEMFDLIARAQRISALTQGAFDITYGSIDKSLWNFDTNMTALPSKEIALESVRLINYQHVILNPERRTVFLKEKGMRIGFGGIGKGYAAEKAKQLLKSLGIQSGIVNAAGDLTTWGNQPNGKPWTIGIANPQAGESPFSYLSISDVAVATSGNYEKYVMIDGKKYSHTIDPQTGLPVSGIQSVTIISPNAELSDAMATPVMVMGIRVGLDLINQMRQIACIIIDDQNKIYTSRNINIK